MSFMAVVGTRPDSIKMAPLINALRARNARVDICDTGQHAELVTQQLGFFGLQPDFRLSSMRTGQSEGELAGRITTRMSALLAQHAPDWVLVHGDTLSCLAAAQAAYLSKTRIAHIEAGLRTGNTNSPWPEEMCRTLVARLADLHFAPTTSARDALLSEGTAPDAIHVTGNTSIDAVLSTVSRTRRESKLSDRIATELPTLQSSADLILVTLHRRETQGEQQSAICRAIRGLAEQMDSEFVLPLHPNPKVADVIRPELDGLENVHLLRPLDYPAFVWLMQRARLVLTDSGGVQEEAPALGTPVLVLRDHTERAEALAQAGSELIGTDPNEICHRVRKHLADAPVAKKPTSRFPFGDGKASERISDILLAA